LGKGGKKEEEKKKSRVKVVFWTLKKYCFYKDKEKKAEKIYVRSKNENKFVKI
jgi:hypothetical protein